MRRGKAQSSLRRRQIARKHSKLSSYHIESITDELSRYSRVRDVKILPRKSSRECQAVQEGDRLLGIEDLNGCFGVYGGFEYPETPENDTLAPYVTCRPDPSKASG